MQIDKITRPSVGPDLSRPSPIYRPPCPLSPTLFGGCEVCQGRPQGSPLLIHPTLALTMTTEELLEGLRGHSKGGSGVVGGGDPCGRPGGLLDASGSYKKCAGGRGQWSGAVGTLAVALVGYPPATNARLSKSPVPERTAYAQQLIVRNQ